MMLDDFNSEELHDENVIKAIEYIYGFGSSPDAIRDNLIELKESGCSENDLTAAATVWSSGYIVSSDKGKDFFDYKISAEDLIDGAYSEIEQYVSEYTNKDIILGYIAGKYYASSEVLTEASGDDTGASTFAGDASIGALSKIKYNTKESTIAILGDSMPGMVISYVLAANKDLAKKYKDKLYLANTAVVNIFSKKNVENGGSAIADMSELHYALENSTEDIAEGTLPVSFGIMSLYAAYNEILFEDTKNGVAKAVEAIRLKYDDNGILSSEDVPGFDISLITHGMADYKKNNYHAIRDMIANSLGYDYFSVYTESSAADNIADVPYSSISSDMKKTADLYISSDSSRMAKLAKMNEESMSEMGTDVYNAMSDADKEQAKADINSENVRKLLKSDRDAMTVDNRRAASKDYVLEILKAYGGRNFDIINEAVPVSAIVDNVMDKGKAYEITEQMKSVTADQGTSGPSEAWWPLTTLSSDSNNKNIEEKHSISSYEDLINVMEVLTGRRQRSVEHDTYETGKKASNKTGINKSIRIQDGSAVESSFNVTVIPSNVLRSEIQDMVLVASSDRKGTEAKNLIKLLSSVPVFGTGSGQSGSNNILKNGNTVADSIIKWLSDNKERNLTKYMLDAVGMSSAIKDDKDLESLLSKLAIYVKEVNIDNLISALSTSSDLLDKEIYDTREAYIKDYKKVYNGNYTAGSQNDEDIEKAKNTRRLGSLYISDMPGNAELKIENMKELIDAHDEYVKKASSIIMSALEKTDIDIPDDRIVAIVGPYKRSADKEQSIRNNIWSWLSYFLSSNFNKDENKHLKSLKAAISGIDVESTAKAEDMVKNVSVFDSSLVKVRRKISSMAEDMAKHDIIDYNIVHSMINGVFGTKNDDAEYIKDIKYLTTYLSKELFKTADTATNTVSRKAASRICYSYGVSKMYYSLSENPVIGKIEKAAGNGRKRDGVYVRVMVPSIEEPGSKKEETLILRENASSTPDLKKKVLDRLSTSKYGGHAIYIIESDGSISKKSHQDNSSKYCEVKIDDVTEAIELFSDNMYGTGLFNSSKATGPVYYDIQINLSDDLKSGIKMLHFIDGGDSDIIKATLATNLKYIKLIIPRINGDTEYNIIKNVLDIGRLPAEISIDGSTVSRAGYAKSNAEAVREFVEKGLINYSEAKTHKLREERANDRIESQKKAFMAANESIIKRVGEKVDSNIIAKITENIYNSDLLYNRARLEKEICSSDGLRDMAGSIISKVEALKATKNGINTMLLFNKVMASAIVSKEHISKFSLASDFAEKLNRIGLNKDTFDWYSCILARDLLAYDSPEEFDKSSMENFKESFLSSTDGMDPSNADIIITRKYNSMVANIISSGIYNKSFEHLPEEDRGRAIKNRAKMCVRGLVTNTDRAVMMLARSYREGTSEKVVEMFNDYDVYVNDIISSMAVS